MRISWAAFSTVLLFVGAESTIRAETLDELEKKLSEAASKHRALQFKDRTVSEMRMPGMTMKSATESTISLLRKGDKWLSRMETKSTNIHKTGEEKEQKNESTLLSVYDGEFSWTLSESSGVKTVIKMKPDPKEASPWHDVKVRFEDLRKSFEVKVLPEQTLDGEPMYVIETKPKKASPMETTARTVIYYSKETAVQMKSVAYDKDGKEMSTSVTSDVKLDPKLTPDQFVFKVPEGVQVLDMTKRDKADGGS